MTTTTAKKAKETNKGKELFVLTLISLTPRLERYIIDRETPRYYHTTQSEKGREFRCYWYGDRFPKVGGNSRNGDRDFVKAYLSYAEACDGWREQVSRLRERLLTYHKPLTATLKEWLAELSALQDLLTDEAPAHELRKLDFLKWNDD